ncbi:hypothetical protein M3Y94_00444300 [Aphelenchoides besseyi]|nr:hypothetical protein M3Y94_00444300 [Aphelenchoides besseyi]KAI6229366.1 PX domain-containing protein [Aphelenchoides besseyi]
MVAKTDPADLLRATIIGTEITTDHVNYVIQCSYYLQENSSWIVRRRYRDFHRLNGDLEPFGFSLGLPPKKFFGNKTPAFVEERKAQLQEFLNNITIHPLIYCTATVSQFLQIADESLKEYENHVLVSARNKTKYRLIRLWHGCSWRFYKLLASLSDVTQTDDSEAFVLAWMPFGPDSCFDGTRKCQAVLNDCLKFMNGLQFSYLHRSVDSYVDDHGIGVISKRLQQENLRDRLYNSKPENTFIRKYSMNRDCYVINKIDAIFIARQMLEVISILNEIGYPYFNFHCGNLAILDDGCQILDLEFALAGHSAYNRKSLICSKAKTLGDMRLFSFAHCLYEMVTGTIVFPDHDLAGALDCCPIEIYDILINILAPKTERMPTVTEVINLPVFESIQIKPFQRQKVLIPNHVKDHFQKVTQKIEQRLNEDREKYFHNVQQDQINRYLSSEEEKTRRRTIIQRYLLNNINGEKQDDRQSSANVIQT